MIYFRVDMVFDLIKPWSIEKKKSCLAIDLSLLLCYDKYIGRSLLVVLICLVSRY